MSKPKKWKRGDIGPHGKVFLKYQKECKNGERWASLEKFAEIQEGLMEYAAKKRREDPSKVNEDSSRWRKANLESRRRYEAEWSRNKYQMDPESARERSRKWAMENPEKVKESQSNSYWKMPEARREAARRYAAENPEKIKAKTKAMVENIHGGYVAHLLLIPMRILRNYPDLIEAKRELLKSHRTLKQIENQTQCTRIQPRSIKSVITSLKPPIPHGLTSLLSLELSSWSTPWVRQLTQLLSKSKRQR